MSSKRDRETSSDGLNESARTSFVPRHLSSTSIADTPSSSSLRVQLLRLMVGRQRLELLHEQQLRDQKELDQHDSSHSEHEQLIHKQQRQELAQVLHLEQQVQVQLEKYLHQLEE